MGVEDDKRLRARHQEGKVMYLTSYLAVMISSISFTKFGGWYVPYMDFSGARMGRAGRL